MLRLRCFVLVVAYGFLSYPANSFAQGLDIALTNDDGWQAVGIQALQKALEAAGHTTTLVAPADQQSGTSAAIDGTDIDIVRMSQNQFAVFACLDDVCSEKGGAKPITSALVAIDLTRRRAADSNADLVISGINQGSNIGLATQMSGTVGATLVALSHAMNGSVPAIAISTDEPPECGGDWKCIGDHYERVADFVVRLVDTLQNRMSAAQTDSLLPKGIGLNVNHPPTQPKGIRVVPQGKESAMGDAAMVVDVGCETCLDIEVGQSAKPSYLSIVPDTGIAPRGETESFIDGYITIVPMQIDYTAPDYESFSSWFDGGALSAAVPGKPSTDGDTNGEQDTDRKPVMAPVTDDKAMTYRRFNVIEADGRVLSMTPVPEKILPRWARDASQAEFDWAARANQEPLFAKPIQFVIPPVDDGEPFWTFNHQPSITWLPNGDLMAIWYSTRKEAGTELTVLASRLRAGADTWDPSSEFFKSPNRNMHGSSIFHDGKGKIYHFNGMAPAGRFDWASLALLMRTSVDNGVTWTPPRAIGANLTGRHQVISGTLMTSAGVLIQNCDAVPGRAGGTALHISHDGGESWSDPGASKPKPNFTEGGQGEGTIAGIHAKVAELSDGRLLALGRADTINGRMPMSISADLGKTWTYQASPFPPIGDAQRLVLKRLQDGALLLVSFTPDDGMTFADQQGSRFTGHGMFAAVSFDDGASWPVRKLLTPGNGDWNVAGWTLNFTTTPTQAEPNGYLAATQTPDGVIHLISSGLHYRFNLAWLTAGTAQRN